MANDADAPGVANPITLGALGILAYIAETMLHEAGGHGAVCLATGGKITLLAPLYMRCSVLTLQMVAAGPAMNILAGLASWLALRFARPGSGALGYFLWLSLIFNWLVAAGYMLVGAMTGFGDWGVLFGGIRPDWAWRIPAGIAALLLYLGALNLASRAFVRLTGLDNPGVGTRARLILVPAGAAAAVAPGAEYYGQGGAPLGLGLAFGCTLFVGLTLMGIGSGNGMRTIGQSRLRIGFNAVTVAVAALVAAGFILFVGSGADLSAL